MTVSEKRILDLAERLRKDVVDNPNPESETCLMLLRELKKETFAAEFRLVENTKVDSLLSRALRTFKRQKRSASNQNQDMKEWINAVQESNKLLEQWKTLAKKEVKKTTKNNVSTSPGLPKTVEEYRTRLILQKKDLFKDPPVLPPNTITTESKKCSPPKREKKTGLLTFVSNDPKVKALLKDFHPNQTPEEILRAGSFGGTYFRPITSAVTNISYNAQDVLNDTVHKDWINGLPMNMLTSKTYRSQINKYGVNCGGSLGMWESSGWITDIDPYGWFQWYCRFFQGRRCSDDYRQISRWLKSAGPKGRFRSQLCNKILAAQTTHDDMAISPVIRQTLLHWGLEITRDILHKHCNRVAR